MMIKKSKKKADDDVNEAVQTRIKEIKDLHSKSSQNILAEMIVGAGSVHHSMDQLTPSCLLVLVVDNTFNDSFSGNFYSQTLSPQSSQPNCVSILKNKS